MEKVKMLTGSSILERYNQTRFPMSSQILSPNREAAIWARLIQAQKGELSSAAAEFLLSIDFEESDRQRMQTLAERSEAGTLTADEQAEIARYVQTVEPLLRRTATIELDGQASIDELACAVEELTDNTP